MTPFRIVIIFVVLSVLGLVVLPLHSVDLLPADQSPKFTISYQLPDASPEYLENEATGPLENVLSQLSGIKSIYSISNYDQGHIELTFEKDEDLAYKRFEITSLIRRTYPQLNPKLTYPTIDQRSKESDDDSPILMYNVNGSYAPQSLRTICEDYMEGKLLIHEEIDRVWISGAEDMQISIVFDATTLHTLGITEEQIFDALRARHEVLNIGKYREQNGQQFFIKMGKPLSNIQELAQTAIVSLPDQTIRLKDFAEVYLEEQEPKQYLRINGETSVTLSIYTRQGANRLKLANQIKNQMSDLASALPKGVSVHLSHDDTEFLSLELDKIYMRSGLSILILLLFIFLINRDVKYLMVLFFGILVNFSLVSLLAWVFGITVHLYTIAGITISLGLIVDNSIVMIDHLYKTGNKKIINALLAASLTSIAALMLVFFLPDEEMHNLLEFSKIVSLSLGVSFLISLYFTPALRALLSGGAKSTKIAQGKLKLHVKVIRVYGWVIIWLARYQKLVWFCLVLGFGTPIFLLPSKWEGQDWYNATIGSSTYQDEIRPVVDPLLGGALRLFVRNVFEKSTYREPEKTQLYVSASLPFGHTVHQMNEVLRGVETYLSQVEGIDRFISTAYSGQYGQVVISFDEHLADGGFPYELKSKLIARSLDWGGIDWDVYGVGKGFSNEVGEGLPRFRVKMVGYNFEELRSYAELMAGKLEAHQRVQEVNTNAKMSWRDVASSEYQLVFDQHQLMLAGLSMSNVATGLKVLAKPSYFSNFMMMDHHLFPVMFKSSTSETYSEYEMLNRPVFQGLQSFKIKDVATNTLMPTASGIHKEDRQYIRMLDFDYSGSEKFGDKFLTKVMKEMENVLPQGFSMEKLAFSWDWDKKKREYGLLVVLIVAVYFICAILFENLIQPFYIILMIPISFMGTFLTFSLFDLYFDQGGYAAFILLGGLVVNAAIFIVDDFNRRRTSNKNTKIAKVVGAKAFPIITTVISTVAGLLPFIISGQDEIFWFSLAAGTIGGLVFSLVGIFLVLPMFFVGKKYALDSKSN